MIQPKRIGNGGERRSLAKMASATRKTVVGAAVKSHSARGPGSLESDYEGVLAEGLKLDEGFRADIIAEEK
jgi:hypothetical protein